MENLHNDDVAGDDDDVDDAGDDVVIAIATAG